jgi:predicted transposase YdaD
MGKKDKAFRRLLGDKELFLRFLRRFLRQDLPYTVDPETLTLDDLVLENITFIPPDLTEKLSDVVYSIHTGDKKLYVYVLVEHQSETDFLMPYRLLSYMVQLWGRCVEEVGEHARRKSFLLPPIVPVVFYEGAKRWTAERNFRGKVEHAEEFHGYIPDFTYRLISLRDKTTQELLSFKDALGGLLYLANPAKEENLLHSLEKIHQFLGELPFEESKVFARHLLGYLKILLEKEGIHHEGNSLEEFFENEEAEEMISYLEREIRTLKQEGRQEGRLEGRQEGRREAHIILAVSMLREGIPLPTIAKITGFLEEEIQEFARQQAN